MTRLERGRGVLVPGCLLLRDEGAVKKCFARVARENRGNGASREQRPAGPDSIRIGEYAAAMGRGSEDSNGGSTAFGQRRMKSHAGCRSSPVRSTRTSPRVAKLTVDGG